MVRRSAPAAHLCLPVGSRHEVVFLPFPCRAPMFVINTGSTVVSLTLADEPDAAQVSFARQLAAQAAVYAVAVERRFRGLAPLGPPAPGTA
jgi:hypothetical protein